MKKIKRVMCAIALMLVCITPLFAGCSLNVFGNKSQLDTPEITLYNEDNCFTFDAISDAKSYDIYCNSKVVDTYENSEDLEKIVYDFSYLLEESGSYKFYIIAISSSLYLKDSDASNEVEKVYTKITDTVNNPTGEDAIVDINFTINSSGVLNFSPIENEEYKLYMYSNNTGLKSYSLNSNTSSINLRKYTTGGQYDIYAVKLGFSNESGEHISNQLFYNTVSVPGYSDKIYIFDGYIHDYYITSLPELKNILYYTFIYRIEDFDIKLSETFKTFISNSYPGNYMVSKMNNAINQSIRSGYYETRAYETNNINGGFAQQLSNSTEFNIKISYYGVTECNININPNNVYPQSLNYGYYDTVDYEMLGDDYDSFVSDNYYLSTTCTTSEELYWAVENKITPKVVKDSRADLIYKEAKNVLRSIISEEMTDYEKVLSIFDWICVNTNYDYSDYSNSYVDGLNLKSVPTLLPCYYLEGVFMTGYSVCDGFSKAYSLMCNMLGIDCIRIVGMAEVDGEEGGHAWNKVYVDKDESDSVSGKYYLVDITWTEIISKTTEEMSHLYFLISDNDVADSHTNFPGRNEFVDYYASENFYYYLNDKFTHYDKESGSTNSYNWVMESQKEIEELFEYALDNQIRGMEFVVDIDLMIDYYNYVNGENSYLSSNKIDYTYDEYDRPETAYVYNEDTLYVFVYVNGVQYVYESYPYYKLRSTFIECMRTLKAKVLPSQYFLITNYDGTVQYSSNENDIGLLYIMQHNLLIDSVTNDPTNGLTDEPAQIINYFNTYGVEGSYTLYVDNEILRSYSGSYLQRMQALLTPYMTDATFSINLTHIDATETEQIFEMTIIRND